MAPAHPLNIMADPRVVRGSVVAKQREELAKIRQQIEAREADERYRTEVIRNRLSLALGGGPKVISSAAYGLPSSPRRMARLAGRVGRGAVADWMSGKGPVGVELGAPIGIDAKISPRITTTSRKGLRTKQLPRTVTQRTTAVSIKGSPARSPGEIALPELTVRVDHRKRGKTKIDFRNVRFIPLKPDESPERPHKVVPSITAATTTAAGITTSPEDETVLPPRAAPYSLRRRKPWEEIPDLPEPPPTASEPITVTDASVQTDEVFDQAFGPLIVEMVAGAINDALRSLHEEDEIQAIQAKNQELLSVIVTERQKNTQLNQHILEHIEQEQELEKEKHEAIKRLQALDCRRLAVEVVADVLEKSFKQLSSHNLIEDEPSHKSVAADTRQLEHDYRKREKTIAEVEKDFFPYVYAKAERIFVHRLADSYLKDALFSKDDRQRADAQHRLNTQIAKYTQPPNPMKEFTVPTGQYSKNDKRRKQPSPKARDSLSESSSLSGYMDIIR